MTLKPEVKEWLASLPGQAVLFDDKPVSFLGRNGVYGALGLYLARLDSSPVTGPLRLQIQPITSKGNLGRGWLEIPLATVPTLIAALQSFLARDCTMRQPSKFVQIVTAIDPGSKRPVDVEIRKLDSGPMIGIDASYLEQEVGPVFSPYDEGVEINIPDDEE
jgi:hypothetical protein